MAKKIRIMVTIPRKAGKIGKKILLEEKIICPSMETAFDEVEALRIVKDNNSVISSLYGCLLSLEVGVEPEISVIENNNIRRETFWPPRKEDQSKDDFSKKCFDFLERLKKDLKV